jgi:Bacterial Ig-like domain (group 2)
LEEIMLKRFVGSVGKGIRSNRTFLFLAAGTAILGAIAFTLASVAANDAFLPRSNHAQASRSASVTAQANKTHMLYSGFWRTDASFVSTIRVKNVLVVAPVDVTPVLFMADGTSYMLSSVHIPVSGVATINLNDALAAASSSIASHISQFGSAALIYSYPSPGHVTAQMAAIDASRSLSYTYPFVEPMNMPGHDSKQVFEGLWWKHDSGVTGFVTLSNTTDQQQAAVLTPVHPGNNSNPQQVTLAPHSTQMLKLEEIATEVSDPDNRAGGIRVEYEGSQGTILVTGALVNESEGYSANMPFWFHDMSSSSPTQITYASAGLMLGKPDPMMMPGFPKDTAFSAYLSLRNTTDRPLDIALQLNYMSGMGMEGSAPVNRSLPAQHLAPFEAKQVNLQGAFTAARLKNVNGSINLSTSFTGNAGDLVLATGSIDQTGSYVFEVEPESVGSFRSKNANYWGVANGNDTMLSLWNPTGASQDILVTFYYGNGSGKYKLPLHLGPQTSTMIDMAMLIAENEPDPDGHVIPSNIEEGSAEFASAKGRNEQITLVIAAGIYNVSTATCGGGCINCCGVSNFGIDPNPTYCPIGETMPCSSTAVDCNGNEVYPSSWSSSNTAVMTVDGSGNVQGVAVGSATITAYFDNVVTYTGQICGGPISCPLFNQTGGAPGNVTPRIDSISPSRGLIGATTSSVTISGKGFSGGHVNTPAAIQVSNITTSTDTQITFDAVISSTATPGNNAGAISVTTSGQTSNAKDFYVQEPTSLSIIPGTAGGTTEIQCTNNACGTIVSFKYQVNDQDSPAQPVRASMSMWDSFGSFSPDGLNLNGAPQTTTCSPVNTGPCGVNTSADGTFLEAALGGCSTVCLVNGACTTGGPSGVTQTWHIAGYAIAQQVSAYCQKVLVNGTQIQ